LKISQATKIKCRKVFVMTSLLNKGLWPWKKDSSSWEDGISERSDGDWDIKSAVINNSPYQSCSACYPYPYINI
jgi:hypothetical protein